MNDGEGDSYSFVETWSSTDQVPSIQIANTDF